MIVINQRQVVELLDMRDCMDAMRAVLADLTRGACEQPLRQILWLPERIGALGMMPSYWQTAGVIGLKAVSFFPGNEGGEFDTHQGAVLLFDGRQGRLLAAVDATSITAIRTAAVSGVATDLLARKDATKLALIGSGVQAKTHLNAMTASRPITEVYVSSKTMERAEAFADERSEYCSMPITPVRTVEEAVAEADIVCTVTSSAEPVLKGEWIKPGTHINAVGSSVATARELDSSAVRLSRLFVDRRESTLNEAGDFLIAKAEGVVGDEHILAEIGEVLIDAKPGRSSTDEITLFKSVGLAVEDLAAAHCVYEKALSTGIADLEFGGARDAAY